MANKKITELDAITTLASTDVVPVVDVSADTTNKITTTNLFRTLPDGTAAAPSLSFASDAANGIYLASSDTVGISTGGTQRVTVDGSGNVTISGDLTVSGATTTVESTTVTIDDKNIELGSVASPSNTTADGGGITLKGATDKTIKWINSTGFWTFNTGVEIDGNLQMDDGKRIRLGTGQDLQIYHDGSNSYVQNNNSTLIIDQTADDQDILLRSDNGSGGTATYVQCDGSAGNVRLYHYGTEKFKTKSDGIDVVGEVQCDFLDVDGGVDIDGGQLFYDATNNLLRWADNAKATFGASNDLQIYHDGSASYIADNGTGNLNIQTNGAAIVLTKGSSENLAKFISDGAVELYYDNAKKLETLSTGASVTGNLGVGESAPGDRLTVGSTSDSSTAIRIQTTTTGNSEIRFGDSDSATAGYIRYAHNGNHLIFARDGAEAMRVSTGGRLLIGTTATSVHGDRLIEIGSTSRSATYQAITTSTSGTGGIVFADTTTNDTGGYRGIIQYAHSSDSLQFSAGATERLRITSTGLLDVTGGIQVSENVTPTSGSGVEIFKATSTAGQIQAYNRDSSVPLDLILKGNNLQFFANGSERLRVDTDGRVGIGNTSMGSFTGNAGDNLVVGSGSGSEGITVYSGTTGQGAISFADGTSGNAQYRGAVEYNHTNDRLSLRTAGTGHRMVIDSSGRVGIGTADPQRALVVSDAGTEGFEFYPGSSAGNNTVNHYNRSTASFVNIITTADQHIFGRADGEKMRLDSSGRLLLGTTTEGDSTADNLTIADSGNCGITVRSGTSSSGSIFFSDATSGSGEYDGYVQYQHDNRALRFATAATERLRINSNGAWGIEGASNYGTSGQVLTSNGNDSPTWQDASAVAVGGANAISMNDNVKVNFGAGSDLQIYHDGLNSRIDNTLGPLIIKNEANDQDVILSTDSGSGSTTTYVRCDGSTGQVDLTYYGSTKLNTKSDGVDITGELQCDSLDVDGNVNFAGDYHYFSTSSSSNASLTLKKTAGSADSIDYLQCRSNSNALKAKIGGNGEVECLSLDVNGAMDVTGTATFHNNIHLQDSDHIYVGTGFDIDIYHDGSNSYVKDNGTGNLKLVSNGTAVQIEKSDGENMAVFRTDGAVELYYDNSKKFETRGAGVQINGDLGIGGVSPGNSFDNGAALALGDNDTGIRQNGDGILEVWSNNAQMFRFRNGGNSNQSYNHLNPSGNNSLDLGTSSLRWRNVYTNDLNLSNEGSANDVDGTWGNYTIQEGEDDLFLINRRNGKKYKFNLTEVS